LIPVYLQWAQYLCSLTYSMRIALIYEFGDCEPGEAEKNCDNLLDYTFAEELDVAVYWIILFVLFAVFRMVAMYCLAINANKFY